jgi:hypothetical protein
LRISMTIIDRVLQIYASTSGTLPFFPPTLRTGNRPLSQNERGTEAPSLILTLRRGGVSAGAVQGSRAGAEESPLLNVAQSLNVSEFVVGRT